MRKATLLAGLVLAMMVRAGGTDAAEVEPVQAGWKEADINFTYMGRTTFYSCDSLEKKIENILKDLGAREDVSVRAFGCTSWFTPERFMNVHIKAAVPATTVPGAGLDPEERSRRELIAKVRGESPDDPKFAAEFPAAWKRVTFSRKTRYLEDGDCELVEQLEKRVFKELEVRVIRPDNWCFPGQIRLGQLDLEVEALVALPSPDTAPGQKPE